MEAIDFNQVRHFLKNLPDNWSNYSLKSRNQLLKLMIEAVELRGSRDIEATIIMKFVSPRLRTRLNKLWLISSPAFSPLHWFES